MIPRQTLFLSLNKRTRMMYGKHGWWDNPTFCSHKIFTSYIIWCLQICKIKKNKSKTEYKSFLISLRLRCYTWFSAFPRHFWEASCLITRALPSIFLCWPRKPFPPTPFFQSPVSLLHFCKPSAILTDFMFCALHISGMSYLYKIPFSHYCFDWQEVLQ